MRYILFICLLFLFACKTKNAKVVEPAEPAAYSLSGVPLYAAPPSENLLKKFEAHQHNYLENPTADNLIWYGRFMAYQGKYKKYDESKQIGV